MTRERPVRICEGGEVRLLSATRLVVSFQYKRNAERFQRQLVARFAKFNLKLAEEKTRLMLFLIFNTTNRQVSDLAE